MFSCVPLTSKKESITCDHTTRRCIRGLFSFSRWCESSLTVARTVLVVKHVHAPNRNMEIIIICKIFCKRVFFDSYFFSL